MHTSRALVMMSMLANIGMAWADSAEDTRHSLPPIHVRQSVEMTYQGVNEARANYLAALRDCQAGGLRSRALADQDVALLGTTRYELWFARDIEVVRETSWSVADDGPGGTCLFRLDTTGTQETTTETSYQRVDLATGEKTEEAAAPEALSRTPVERSAPAALGDFQGPTSRTVAGQPCDEWVKPNGLRQCVWSGGTKWGFTAEPLNDHRPNRGFIVLEQIPGADADFRVTTQVMTVGEPFDQAALAAPRVPGKRD
ncbi:hypothetical protein [Pseudomonas sp. EpS/L25]|uniref:hypothetical protein n=1 Tax=Pseudomonas sp. EpS/L25 TaxID=1749078 RepID=UPI00074355A5|nr:hypothetical protein [Pseudomonas sp. EpS/L25]KUM40024.1 hypothetical protein AR540_12025 [Pseudomonas sp. EpS/L25]